MEKKTRIRMMTGRRMQNVTIVEKLGILGQNVHIYKGTVIIIMWGLSSVNPSIKIMTPVIMITKVIKYKQGL